MVQSKSSLIIRADVHTWKLLTEVIQHTSMLIVLTARKIVAPMLLEYTNILRLHETVKIQLQACSLSNLPVPLFVIASRFSLNCIQLL
jgi:hypothetical protein